MLAVDLTSLLVVVLTARRGHDRPTQALLLTVWVLYLDALGTLSLALPGVFT